MQGFVAKVVKNNSVRGGSARPEFVKKHRAPPKVCFCIPVVSLSWKNWFCPPNDDDDQIPNLKDTFIHIPPPTTTTQKLGPKTTPVYDDRMTSFLTSSDLSIASPPADVATDPKSLSHQPSMISYDHSRTATHHYYALKSIIMDRCSTPELQEELKNEGKGVGVWLSVHLFLFDFVPFGMVTCCCATFQLNESSFCPLYTPYCATFVPTRF